MYSVIWKYSIQTVWRKEFEREYGSKGSWVKLFSKSKHFISSRLQKDVEDKTTYIVIDLWKSGEGYQRFLSENEKAYHVLSEKFLSLIKKEEKIGEFESVGEDAVSAE